METGSVFNVIEMYTYKYIDILLQLKNYLIIFLEILARSEMLALAAFNVFIHYCYNQLL